MPPATRKQKATASEKTTNKSAKKVTKPRTKNRQAPKTKEAARNKTNVNENNHVNGEAESSNSAAAVSIEQLLPKLVPVIKNLIKDSQKSDKSASRSENASDDEQSSDDAEIEIDDANEAIRQELDPIDGEKTSEFDNSETLEIDFVRFEPAGVPLDGYVDSKIKAKILSGQFIEYKTLLSENQTSGKRILAFENSEEGGENFCFKVPKSNLIIERLGEWHKCHDIFSTIMIRHKKDPQLAIDLIKYGTLISRLADQGGDWFNYDRQFRMLIATKTGGANWAVLNWELWHSMVNKKPQYTRNQQKGSYRGGNSEAAAQSPGRVPAGYCYVFHRGSNCTQKPCSYKHECPNCGGGQNHPMSRCKKGKGGGGTAPNSS